MRGPSADQLLQFIQNRDFQRMHGFMEGEEGAFYWPTECACAACSVLWLGGGVVVVEGGWLIRSMRLRRFCLCVFF